MPKTDKTTAATILRLKKTESPINGAPMGYREIGMKLGLSGPGVRFTIQKLLKHRCPTCLQPLEKQITETKQPM